MDEIEHWHRGKVDNWHVQRVQAYTIALSSGNYKNPPSLEDMFPLPYDKEETSAELGEDWITFYNNAIK